MMLKRYVFTVRGDVCDANNKDRNATALIEKMCQYGTVEDYDTHVAAVKAEYQAVYDDLNVRYEQIKNQKLTKSEIQLVNLLRSLMTEEMSRYAAEVEAVKKQYGDENEALRNQLAEIKAEHESRIAKIVAAIG